ncbi:MAG: acyltransferase family protein [Hyphomicrobium sp.]
MDSMRGLAVCAVAIFHFNEVGIFAPSAYQDIVSMGGLGVPAFFAISGFAVQSSAIRSTGPVSFL